MLDFPAVVWLEGYLLEWSGTVVTVSHDRYFLDAIATDILHLHNETIDAYRGNYQSFLTSKEDRLRAQQTEYEAQQQHRAHLQAFIDRWRYNANRAAQAQSRIKILEKMPVLRPIVKDVAIVFRLPPVDPIGSPLVTLEDVSFSYASPAATTMRMVMARGMGGGKGQRKQLLLDAISCHWMHSPELPLSVQMEQGRRPF